VLTPVAQTVVNQARKFATSNGRSLPSGEDLLISLFILGLAETPFLNVLQSAAVSANDMRAALLSLEHEREEETFERRATLEERSAHFWESLMGSSEDLVDCCDLVAGLLTSEYLSNEARYLLTDSGLTLDLFLAASESFYDYASIGDGPERPERALCAPPLGFTVIAEDLPVLYGRETIAAEIAACFHVGEQVLIAGPYGCGKDLTARTAAAASGRLAVHVRAEELAAIEPSGRYEALAALVRYLREAGGGLVLTDLDAPALSTTAIPEIDVPLIVTVRDEHAALPIATDTWTTFVLNGLDAQAALGALEAWNREPSHPLVDPNQLAGAIELAGTYLGSDEALPGSAIGLIRAASAPVKDHKSEPIGREHLEEAVCYLTGLPLALVSAQERHKLSTFGERLGQHLIGQRAAIAAVSGAIVRRQLAIGERTRPVGSFLFVGPTGVGKTELARVLAIEMFGSAEALVRFDMAEFFDKYEISRLIGSPPGYIGSDKDGQLISAIKKRPHGVLLLDEIEKADNRLYDFFLGALDYGVVTAANNGEKVSLREWVIIFTSNIGSGEGAAARGKHTLGFSADGENPTQRSAAARAAAIKSHFSSRPEFVNRLDAIVEFEDLAQDELAAILALRFNAYAAEFDSIGMHLALGPALAAQMVSAASSSGMGARDLVTRQFNLCVEDRVNAALLAGMYMRGARYIIEIDQSDGLPTLTRQAAPNRGHH
jgi:MoxR-like ATPase